MAKLWVQKLPIQPRSRKASNTKVLHLDAVTDNLDLLSIVILSHNRRDSLEANLQYYLNNLEYDFELIVCDNQSSDGSAKLLRDLQEQHTALRVVYNEKNLGVGAGRNSGYKIASRPFVLTLDEDAFITIGCISDLVKHLSECKQVGIASPRVIHKLTGAQQNPHGAEIQETANYHGACHIIRSELFESVGYLDNNCRFGGEELDYSIRAKDQGYITHYYPFAEALHDNLTRPEGQQRWRRLQWVYNFSRIHYKHFTLKFASECFCRYLSTHLANSLFREKRPGLALHLLSTGIQGVIAGFKARSLVSEGTENFYRDPSLRPDFGNVPLASKLKKLLVRKHSQNG